MWHFCGPIFTGPKWEWQKVENWNQVKKNLFSKTVQDRSVDFCLVMQVVWQTGHSLAGVILQSLWSQAIF